jgi:phosphoglycolate phosphatase
VNGYDTILFDSDGVLVKPPTHETQLEATRAAFQELGVENADQQHLFDVMDGLTIERLREICTIYELNPDAFWEARERQRVS